MRRFRDQPSFCVLGYNQARFRSFPHAATDNTTTSCQAKQSRTCSTCPTVYSATPLREDPLVVEHKFDRLNCAWSSALQAMERISKSRSHWRRSMRGKTRRSRPKQTAAESVPRLLFLIVFFSSVFRQGAPLGGINCSQLKDSILVNGAENPAKQ